MTTRGGKSTRDPPHLNHAGKGKHQQEKEEEGPSTDEKNEEKEA